MSQFTTLREPELIHDQARELRRLMADRSQQRAPLRETKVCRTLTVFSGKGGVGKSVVALQLAMAMAKQGAAVTVVDTCPTAGNLGILCGQNGYWNLTHVATGGRTLDEVLLPGPEGIRILPGAFLLQPGGCPTALTKQLIGMEQTCDWLILDTPTEVLRHAASLVSTADCALVMTTPEPTSVAAAYEAIKAIGVDHSIVSVLVNQADSQDQADAILNRLRQAARAFLSSDASLIGFVPWDDAIRQSVYRRQPSLGDVPSLARTALEKIAARLDSIVRSRSEDSFFERLYVAGGATNNLKVFNAC